MAKPALIKLPQDSSNAPVLSYNIPQSTAVSGRHFIEISLPGMDDSWFKPAMSPPAQPDAAPQRTAIARIKPAIGDLVALAESQNIDRVAQLVVSPSDVAGGRVSKELQALTTDNLRKMQATGKQPVFYRQPNGAMTYVVSHLPIGGQKPPPNWADVDVFTPAWGATITGPSSGITVTVSGAVTSEAGIPDQVSVFLDSDAAQIIASSASSTGGLTQWFANIDIRTSGPHRVWAKATFKGGYPLPAGSGYIDFTAMLAGDGDNIPVVLKVSSPDNGSTAWDPNPDNDFNIQFSGTAQPTDLDSLVILQEGSTRR